VLKKGVCFSPTILKAISFIFILSDSFANPDPFGTDPDPAFQFDMDPDPTV
jgi:hypothetical protein